MKKIALIYNHHSAFVEKDIALLSKNYEVNPFYYRHYNITEFKRIVKANDIILSWFASRHTLAPFYYAKRYHKKKIVIVGGYDASDIPRYGMFSGFIKPSIVRYIYSVADAILPVDPSLSKVILDYLPEVKNKITVIPTGFDSEKYKPSGDKLPQVLTVCAVNKTNLWRKGLLTFFQVARELPGIKFYVVGHIDQKLNISKYEDTNIIFTGGVTEGKLIEHYQRSKVFCLLSKYEGLPNVLCESMLCQCIPVTTGVCGIPTAQNGFGYYVPYDNVYQTMIAVVNALDTTDYFCYSLMRARIKKLFSLEEREYKLNEIIK